MKLRIACLTATATIFGRSSGPSYSHAGAANANIPSHTYSETRNEDETFSLPPIFGMADVSLVPEPATWAIMGLAFGVAAFRKLQWRRYCLSLVAALSVMCSGAAFANDPGFSASLQDCTELIGLGPIPLASVQALVPANYTIAPFGNGVAGLVVRASECRAFSIDRSPARTVRVAQIGVSIASPDGTGDINNYTLMYATDDVRLAAELLETGLVVGFDPLLAYEYNSATGEIYVSVSPVAMPSWFETGSASNPPAGGVPVIANWWARTRRGTVKMTTSIPAISYGTSAATVLHASKVSPLGSIIGGNTDASFPFFNARGSFATGTFTTGVR